jgi:hypothetical protein
MTILRALGFFLILLLAPLFSLTQGRIEVKASVDKNYIVIGERIQLTLQASFPKNRKAFFFTIDTIPHFEFIERGGIDSTTTSNATILKQVSILTSFDSGRWVLPAFVLRGINARTDTIGISVGFAPFDRNKDYNDIKEVIDVEVEKEENEIPWYWFAIGTALILFIIYLLARKKKKPAVATAPPVDAFREAMRRLDQLEKDSQLQKGGIKEYYSALIEILRMYALRRIKIESLQKTTDDLVVQLKSVGLSTEQYNQLAQILRLSDFVKFAKYVPPPQDNTAALEIIRQSIKTIEQNTHAAGMVK